MKNASSLLAGAAVVAALLPGCAALGELRAFVQPPTFAAVGDRHAEITLDPPSTRRPPVVYRLEGTIGVDAGRLGQPVFGPMTLLQGGFRQSLAAISPRVQAAR